MSDNQQFNPSETQEHTMTSNVPSTETTQSVEPGPTPTEEQLDFDRIWAYNLEKKYGIRDPFAD